MLTTAVASCAFAYSTPADLRDFPEWRRGRTRYGIWMIPVEAPDILGYLDQVRERAGDLLHPPGARQAHLTLFVCGFEAPSVRWNDDFTPDRLHRQIARLEQRKDGPCALPVLPPDSFASAMHIPVGDPLSRLATWRDELDAASREIRQAPYAPHITVGLYRRRVPAEDLRRFLTSLPPPPPALAVGELHYATYDGRDQHGRLETRFRLPLDGSC